MNAAEVKSYIVEQCPGPYSTYSIAGQPLSIFYRTIKRAIDILGSVLGLILCSPLLIVTAWLIRFTSDGPAFYKQIRVGLNGKKFYIYKFRTMVEGAENIKNFLSAEQCAFYQKNRKLVKDPRVTKIGARLRSRSIDELPQLINVLKGDMSLVGPRPMLPEEVAQYGHEYFQYVQTRPGITGLWQIKYRHETEMSARAMVDAEYYQKKCLKEDTIILFATIKAVLHRNGAC